MTINDTKNYLSEFYQQHQSQLIQDYSGINERIFIRSFQDGLDFIHQNQFTQNDIDNYLEQFLTGVPIAYIFGMAYFLDYPFYVNSDVLIPRFETEILVEHARDFLTKNTNAASVADIGCGPGTICLSLARMINRPISLDAYDISAEALATFQMNLDRFRPYLCQGTVVGSICNDRLFNVSKKYDLILSNPPYIKIGIDKHLVHKNVQRYEPELALYLTDEIYETWFAEFFNQIEHCLNPNGLFIMEGHENHLEGLAKFLPSNGTMKFYYDLTGRLRGLMWEKS